MNARMAPMVMTGKVLPNPFYSTKNRNRTSTDLAQFLWIPPPLLMTSLILLSRSTWIYLPSSCSATRTTCARLTSLLPKVLSQWRRRTDCATTDGAVSQRNENLLIGSRLGSVHRGPTTLFFLVSILKIPLVLFYIHWYLVSSHLIFRWRQRQRQRQTVFKFLLYRSTVVFIWSAAAI